MTEKKRRNVKPRAPRSWTPEQRFDAYWELAPNGCWLWTRFLNQDGYGLFTPRKRETWRAHRWSYTQKYGPIPEGMELDHFACDNRACVNPDHVRPVSRRENVLRSNSVAAANLAKTHCAKGHLLPPVGAASRRCQTCRRAWKPPAGRVAARKSHCIRGHELPPAGSDKRRRCQECSRVRPKPARRPAPAREPRAPRIRRDPLATGVAFLREMGQP